MIFMRARQECKVGAKHHLNILRPKFSNYIAIQHSVDVLLRSLINMCLKYGGLAGWPATSWRSSSTLANAGQNLIRIGHRALRINQSYRICGFC